MATRRAAEWNEWSTDETLIQLAGHLKGQALQEWNLLEDTDKVVWQEAAKVLQSRLEHGNRTMAAQQFRHLRQSTTESVSKFIRRLEHTFRIAHGKGIMATESREALLHGQMQEGLLLKLMKSPAESGAVDYKGLCLAAKNEEKRLAGYINTREEALAHSSRRVIKVRELHIGKALTRNRLNQEEHTEH